MKKKVFVLLIAAVLLVGISVGGTVAWLTAQTGPVENTFTVGDIKLDIWEHKIDPVTNKLTTELADDGKNNYNFVPGDTLEKDPTVEVKAGSEACYLFIHAVEANNEATANNITADPIIVWSVKEEPNNDPANGWVEVPDHEDYWYRLVDATGSDLEFPILTDNQVTVNDQVTKEMVPAINAKKPTLTFTAAAVQKDNIADVATAWAQLPEEFKPATTD